VPDLPPVADETRAPPTPAQETDYEPSLAPEPAILVNRSPSITPNSSLQPESEHFPDFPNNPGNNNEDNFMMMITLITLLTMKPLTWMPLTSENRHPLNQPCQF
jgi:hypothetical protein